MEEENRSALKEWAAVEHALAEGRITLLVRKGGIYEKRGGFEVAIISDGADNRYGHPSQEALDRFRAANIKIFRTDLQGEIVITTRGKERDYKVTPAHEAKPGEDMWAGRTPLRDDSARKGFVDFGDLPPAPKPKKEASADKANNNKSNSNKRAAGR